ncbi:MAG: GNAT family N-acetyltransferase [Myxococcota bacterium]
MDAEVVTLRPEETHPLRHRVLRPHQRPEDCVYPGDAVPGAFHAGVRVDGEVVATGSIAPEADPSRRAPLGDWRIRGMAVAERVRGAGHGRRVLDRLVAHARDHGGAAPWCNARVVALGFYRRAGWRTYGEEFEVGSIGPHYVMSRVLPPRPRPAQLQTPRLILEPLRAEHGPHTFEALNDPAMHALRGSRPLALNAHVAATERMARGISPRDDAAWLNWLVFDGPADEDFVGTCQLTLPDGGLATLGYEVVQRRWGRGYAKEAAAAVLRWAVHRLGVPAVEASHDVRNAPSRRVLEQLGFRFVEVRADPERPGATERRYVIDAAAVRGLSSAGTQVGE